MNITGVSTMVDVEQLVEQAKADKLNNLIPLIEYHEMCPKELKLYYGKSLWKLIHKAPKYRIKFLRRHCTLTCPSLIKQALTYPWWYIKHYWLQIGRCNNEFAIAFLSQTKFTKTELPDRVYPRPYLVDIIKMWHELNKKGIPPAVNSVVEFMDLHDNLYREYLNFTYSKEPVTTIINIDIPGYEISPLISGLQLAEESKKMRHCVVSYLDKVKNQLSYIYHIKNINTGEESTLELCNRRKTTSEWEQAAEILKITYKSSWKITQHLGKFNKGTENREINSNLEAQFNTLYNKLHTTNTPKEEILKITQLHTTNTPKENFVGNHCQNVQNQLEEIQHG